MDFFVFFYSYIRFYIYTYIFSILPSSGSKRRIMKTDSGSQPGQGCTVHLYVVPLSVSVISLICKSPFWSRWYFESFAVCTFHVLSIPATQIQSGLSVWHLASHLYQRTFWIGFLSSSAFCKGRHEILFGPRLTGHKMGVSVHDPNGGLSNRNKHSIFCK